MCAVYTCVHMHVDVCMWMGMCVDVFVWVSMYAICMWMRARMHVCLYVQEHDTSMCMHVCCVLTCWCDIVYVGGHVSIYDVCVGRCGCVMYTCGSECVDVLCIYVCVLPCQAARWTVTWTMSQEN